MTFSAKIKSFFTIDARQAGAEYFRTKQIAYRFVGKFAAHATIKTPSTQSCSFLFDEDARQGLVEIQAECTCPAHARGIPCKHLWSLALAMDSDPWSLFLDSKRCVLLDWEATEFGDEDEDAEDENQTLTWDVFKSLLLPTKITTPHIPVAPSSERPRELFFAFDPGVNLQGGDLALRFYYREPMKGGRTGALKPLSLFRELNRDFTELEDRKLFDQLLREGDGFKDDKTSAYRKGVKFAHKREAMDGVLISPKIALQTFARLAQKGKLLLISESRPKDPLPLDVSDVEWRFEVKVREHDKTHYQLTPVMSANDETRDIEDFHFLSDYRFALVDSCLLATNLFQNKHIEWLKQLSKDTAVIFKKDEFDAFVAEYASFPLAPPMQWPEGFTWTEEVVSPRPKLRLSPYYFRARETLSAEILFQYPVEDVNSLNVVPSWVDHGLKIITLRDFSAESAYLAAVHSHPAAQLIVDPDLLEEGKTVAFFPEHLSAVVEHFESRGWEIDVEGKRLRVLHDFDITAEGETDWFDLSIKSHIDGKAYSVPELLKKKKELGTFIPLGKGELAMLPTEWLEHFEFLKKTGTVDDDKIRFTSQQALMLDVMLSQLKFDNKSERLKSIRHKIQNFKTLQPVEAPKSFQGTLRDYQKEGLAWLEFLQDIGLGACLSDEMGLGKTIQVLAMLARYHANENQAPSLIVVPRSLVSNWIDEAKKFTPSLKVIDMSGPARDWSVPEKDKADLVLTTYGLLRQDIGQLTKKSFGYIILDESQIIKNPGSQAAKAALLLKSQHKLAMSGTPVENHLRELLSLLNFLNPGLLAGDHWQEMLNKKFDPTEPFVKNLTTAVRPLMLRRTKAQVLKDLPPKIEDVLYCDLEGEQKKHYDDLRRHYQMNLLPSLQDETWKNSPIVVIEALLRLRQAACHSGLVSEDHIEVPSAKMETLFDKLEEIKKSGHKALIFSQFTSFLKIVRKQFLAEGIPFEYLDGSTRDRAARTERFQTDPDVPFFLISLKAGGVGLNLTAADYCFILDPWWNPAAEAQAIDRAHRIHQKNTVIAYRIIARDTVEEKIQALQKHKRDMVESILDGEGTLLRDLDLKSIQSLFR